MELRKNVSTIDKMSLLARQHYTSRGTCIILEAYHGNPCMHALIQWVSTEKFVFFWGGLASRLRFFWCLRADARHTILKCSHTRKTSLTGAVPKDSGCVSCPDKERS